MSWPVVLLPRALGHLREAAGWYGDRSAGAGDRFLDRVQEVLDRLAATPELHPVIEEDVRRARVRQFPYNVMYRLEVDRVLVVAIVHASRDASSWRGRV